MWIMFTYLAINTFLILKTIWEVKCPWWQPFSNAQSNGGGVMCTEYCRYFIVCHRVFDCFLHFLASASHTRPRRLSESWFWKSNVSESLPQPLWAWGIHSVSKPVSKAHIIYTTQCCWDRKMRERPAASTEGEERNDLLWQVSQDGPNLAVRLNKGCSGVFMLFDKTQRMVTATWQEARPLRLVCDLEG